MEAFLTFLLLQLFTLFCSHLLSTLLFQTIHASNILLYIYSTEISITIQRPSQITMAVVSCPVGGLSYTCATTNPTFLGCCDINPCYSGNCPPVSLYPMGLGDNYTYVPGHSCPNGGQWWTCADQKPTFQGCCATDPCDGIGCPTLIAAGLDTNSQTAPTAVASPSDLVSSNTAGQSPACTRRSSASFSRSITYDSASTGSRLTSRGYGGNQTTPPPAAHLYHIPLRSSGTRSVRGGTVAGVAVLLLAGALIIFTCAGITG